MKMITKEDFDNLYIGEKVVKNGVNFEIVKKSSNSIIIDLCDNSLVFREYEIKKDEIENFNLYCEDKVKVFCVTIETDEGGISSELFYKREDAVKYLRSEFERYKDSDESDEEYAKHIKRRGGNVPTIREDYIYITYECTFNMTALFYGSIDEKEIR